LETKRGKMLAKKKRGGGFGNKSVAACRTGGIRKRLGDKGGYMVNWSDCGGKPKTRFAEGAPGENQKKKGAPTPTARGNREDMRKLYRKKHPSKALRLVSKKNELGGIFC